MVFLELKKIHHKTNVLRRHFIVIFSSSTYTRGTWEPGAEMMHAVPTQPAIRNPSQTGIRVREQSKFRDPSGKPASGNQGIERKQGLRYSITL